MNHTSLLTFANHVRDLPNGELIAELRAACTSGAGFWNVPTTTIKKPAIFEISVYGVFGAGLSLEEAALSWRRAVLSMGGLAA